MKEKSLYIRLIPVMLVFFTMGFVDLVGIASNYVKLDLGLTDSEANIFPSLVFFWFLIFSVPTGMLMNKIGRPGCYLRVVADPMFRRWLYGDVGLFFFIRDRECFDADLSEPASL